MANNKREELENWLNDKPREWANVIAVRAALRVVPMLSIALSPNADIESATREIILPTFHRLDVSWVASAWSILGSESYAEKYHSPRDPNVAHLAADASIDASNSFMKSTEPSSFAANSVIFAMRSAGATHADNIWNAVWADARALESERPSDLAIQALWQHGIPSWMNHYWVTFKRVLLEANEDWNVWTDWYDARLKGANKELLDQALEVARTNIAETILNQSPRVVNAYIKRIIDDHNSKKLPSQPPEGPGPRFTPTPQGFEIVPSAPTVSERGNPTQISLHRQLIRRVERLALVISRIQNTHKPLFDEFNDYATFVETDLATLDVPTLWSVGAALNDMVEAYAYPEAAVSQTMSEHLEPDILSQLRSLLRDHTTFIMGFEQGQELSARVAALRALDVKVADLAVRSRDIFVPMLRTKFLLAANARTLVQSIDRTLDVVDEKTLVFVGAAVAVGTRSIVAFGRAVAPIVMTTAVVTSITGINVSTLLGDPNGEALRAALTYLTQNANALAAFASHDAQLKLWLDWLITEIRRNTPPEKSL